MRIAQNLTKTVALLAILSLAGCGQTGALYLPKEPEPTAPETQSDQPDQTEPQSESE